jgi:predicted MFS family arabinose efflux permease
MIPSHKMSPLEKKSALALSGIFGCRMLGLFMILPVFTLYADTLVGSTPFLIGLAMGIYGFTQALLQIPFGALSDRLGRKRIITLGLILFALGSILAAMSHSIYGVIAGRALQGAGAIGSTTIALLADLTHEDHRSKAMAIIGMIIGFSFMVAMIVGPMINAWVGVSGIFWFTTFLALLGIVVLFTLVPKPQHNHFHRDSQPIFKELPRILKNKQLLCIDFSVFVQHALLTAIFVVLPVIFHRNGLLETNQWKLYLPVLLIAFVVSIPCIIIGEKKRKIKPMLLLGISAILISQFGFWFLQHSIIGLTISLALFFTAFTLLEALLPSLVSKLSPAGSKGTATGVYSTAQFLGIFVGGVVAGALYEHYHITDVFWFCLSLCVVWLMTILQMKKPAHISSLIASVSDIREHGSNGLKESIEALPGVVEVALALEEDAVYLKIDKDSFDEDRLQCLLHPIDSISD